MYHIRDSRFVRFENGICIFIVELDCDTPSDLPTVQNNWEMGSIAHVISTGDFYSLNSSGIWVNQTENTTD